MGKLQKSTLCEWGRHLCCWQRELDGDVTLCCAAGTGRLSVPLKCGGAAGICQNLYDSAPSGQYGTMSYLCRSVVQCLNMPTAADGNLDCVIQWSVKFLYDMMVLCTAIVFLCFHRPLWTSCAHNHDGMFACFPPPLPLRPLTVWCVQIVLLACSAVFIFLFSILLSTFTGCVAYRFWQYHWSESRWDDEASLLCWKLGSCLEYSCCLIVYAKYALNFTEMTFKF